MSALIAKLTDGGSPFKLTFYIRLQATSPTYVALDSIRLINCYQGDKYSVM